jgi:hypothetical protein
MNPNKLTFESEDLIVDWISFKFQYLDNINMMQIANYLLKLGFNSYQESGKLAQPIKESILVSPQNKFQALFITEGAYWEGTTLHFSGSNAFVFYMFVQKELIHWTIFSSAILSRFDLYYSRKNKKEDKTSTREFLENSQRDLNQSGRNVSLEKNSKGFILRIGNRRTNNYFRIYEKENSLKFEHEMKGKFLRKYHKLLISNRKQEFEQELCSHFLLSFGKLFSLNFNYPYLDWLVIKLRPTRKQRMFQQGLHSDYIKSEILMDTAAFVSLLQLLNFARSLDYEVEYLGSTAYRKVVFKLRDFYKFQDPSVQSESQYQSRKIKEFFQQLQAGLYATSFSDHEFQSLVIIPQIKFEKCSKHWIGKVWLVEELFFYKYPFYLPNFFQQKLTKHELEVCFKMFQVFTSVSVEKKIHVQDFFKSYPSALNNQQKTKLKKCFIELVQILENSGLIESKYKIIFKGILHETQTLTSRNISEGFVIYEKLSI